MGLFPFEPPSLQKIVRRVVDDVRTRMQTGAALLAHTAEAALAAAVAGVAHPLWRALDRASRVSLWATAIDTTYLEIWASIFGVFRKDPTKATGTANATTPPGPGIAVTGTNDVVVPAGTRWQRSPDGFEYTTTADVTIVGGVGLLPFQAKESGALGNIAVNTPVFIIGSIPGLNSSAYISGGDVKNGIDREPLHQLQARFFDRLRYPPKGGGKGDYIRWAKEKPFVTRAWEYGKEPQLGYVTVRVVTDFEDQDTVMPDPSEREELRAYIQERMPLGLTAVVADDVVVVDLDPEIAIKPNTGDTIEAARKAMLLALSRGRIGPSSFNLSLLTQAMRDEPLVHDFEWVSPIDNIVLGDKEVLTLGTPVWSALP